MGLFKRLRTYTMYCSHCGGGLREDDRAHSTRERVRCRRCDRFVWVSDEHKYDDNDYLRTRGDEKRAQVRFAPKPVVIRPRFCHYCGSKITHTVAIWGLAHDLQCPVCGEVAFYEDVVREKCLACKHYNADERGTYDKCKEPILGQTIHMNEPECSGFELREGR